MKLISILFVFDVDHQDCTVQANQRPDKSFQGPPFGKTLHCGESVRQRESIVSKVFDICIIVEGKSIELGGVSQRS